MIILTDTGKLLNATEKEKEFLKYRSGNKLFLLTESDSIPVSIISMVCGYGSDLNVIESGADMFSLGFTIGTIVSGSKEKVVILLNRELSINNANVEIGIPEKKKRTEKGESKPVTRRRKVQQSESKEERISEEDLPFPTPVVEEVPFSKLDNVRSQMLNDSNETLSKLAKDENTYRKLIKAIKDSSDKTIGLTQLLNIHIGKEITPLIINDIQDRYYNTIKEN